ncbi:hypothetical protein SCB29_08235 [Paraburkholderia sp. SIMBA_055]|jgi:hypothetical protein|uniref:Uncharacterized protein n=1 Tax=Paraburkholderia graminis (strain ATCC 700544 / DSM 17151 / LMG 18924 / NCIMB 13744 / C4D1M) TaxID=396598 RepID=B1G1B9_PARG4|nr:hypothetical protein [Paraburkholderia graminis]EDT10350.1 conserved hypothetical protein [Paraburkholderia graminis C4D1M]CAB3660434.1 hypothetical protein R8871_01463 [Paraburkholderia graminis C4D1M]
MIKRLVIAAVLSTSAAIAAPVFASSGYGPAPHYDPLIGAPSSQRGQSAETVRAEQTALMASADIDAQSYGGMHDTTSQAGSRSLTHASDASDISIAPYAHH